MGERKVTVLEPTKKSSVLDRLTESIKKLNVAAYARVSTELEEQQNSYEAQVKYYTEYINNNPSWNLVAVYSDEGISGTNTKHREGFNRMMDDARSGKIDLILTKSISRFARNTVDTLNCVRELKSLGIKVYFEKENIDTMDAKGEVMLTILSSLAQEESRSISENVRWGKQRSMQQGKVSMPYSSFLGYRKGDDGRPEIVEEEAKIVRRIYDEFLKGTSLNGIARMLTNSGICTPRGKKVWQPSTVKAILTNEKYKGDALLQKTYVEDFLTKKITTNKGELPQYYVEDSHPAIISKEKFDLVQERMKNRTKNRLSVSNNSPFTCKIICADCGGFYGRKFQTGNYHTWYCNHRYDGEDICNTPIIKEERLHELYKDALLEVLEAKSIHIENAQKESEVLSDVSELDASRIEAEKLLQDLLIETQNLIRQNATILQDQTIYQANYDRLCEKIELEKAQIEELDSRILKQKAKAEELRIFAETLENLSQATASRDSLSKLFRQAFVNKEGIITFEFMNDYKISKTI